MNPQKRANFWGSRLIFYDLIASSVIQIKKVHRLFLLSG
ncbi:hypothetical protein RV08_GL000331 [Enterococcus mundtii]|nr:hypothetical protein RV08_GL000331 [Enterococcus mundtii]